MTQTQAATVLGISQPFLSQIEKGMRNAAPGLERRAMDLYELPPTALALSCPEQAVAVTPDCLEKSLAALGYPGFAHVRSEEKHNPAEVVLGAITQSGLDARLVEALPWVMARYTDLNWCWLRDNAKLRNVQNRLGYVVYLAKEIASAAKYSVEIEILSSWEQDLEEARLAREDTLCRESMSKPEREWVRAHRSSAAVHWNLLTTLTPEQLPYATR